MKKNFKLEITYEVEIREGEFKGSDDRCLAFIDEYINEYIKDPEAILAFYKIYLLTFLSSCKSDPIQELLGIDNNSHAHYLKVADKCSPLVKEFIYGLFSKNYIPKMDKDEKEKYQGILEDQFKELIIIDASFREGT